MIKLSFIDNQFEKSIFSFIENIAKITCTKFAIAYLKDEADEYWISSKKSIDLNNVSCPNNLLREIICENKILNIPSLKKDIRFNNQTLTLLGIELDFIFCHPIITNKGHNLGSIVLLNDTPKSLSNSETAIIDSFCLLISDMIQTKLINNNLKNINNQYKDVQAMVKAGAWELDIKTGNTEWSDQIYDIYQLPLGTPTNKIDGLSYYLPHEREKLAKLIEECIVSRKSFDAKFEFCDAKKNKKWVHSIGRPVTNDKNEVIKVIGTFQDITTQMNQEKKIKNAYDVLDLTVEGANIGTWSWNLLDNTVIYSSKWAELRGLSTSDLKMSIEDWSSRVHPDDLNFAYERINDYKLGKSKYFEALHRVKHRSGKWIYILGRGKFTDYDENNKPVRFVGIDVDISELTESKKKLETIFKFSPVTLFECLNNNKWTMTYLSPQIYDLSGYKANDLLLDFNISFLEIIYDEDRDIVRNTIEQIFKDNSYYEIEYRIRHISGELKWVWERGSLSKDKNTVNGVIVDITDKKRIEKDLEDQRQIVFHQSKLASIGQLAAGVGHEINNPLTIVKGQLDMITHQNQNNKDLTNRLNKVSLAIDRIVNIVRGLKNLARTDHEVFEQFSLTDMLSETINMINEIYKAENISLSTDIEKNINIVGNLGRLQQVVMNLLINAKDALSVSKNKQVFLTMKSHLHHVEIIVRDTGSGISPNIIDKIFDPFFTTKEVNKGTGMGLALVNKIIEEHQGSIKTHSIENVGTTFNVNIPLLKENETKSNLNEHTASETAVIVDDEEEIIEILKDLLKDLGIDAKGFTKAQDAIKWIEKNNSVGHIFSDLKMPQMSGVDFVKTIKSKNKYLGKVYFISGGTTVGIEDLKNISDGFIEKPFNKNKIKDLLGK